MPRLHFVPRPATGRTSCGIPVTEEFDSHTPLVFGDLDLWGSPHWRSGRCWRCLASLRTNSPEAPAVRDRE